MLQANWGVKQDKPDNVVLVAGDINISLLRCIKYGLFLGLVDFVVGLNNHWGFLQGTLSIVGLFSVGIWVKKTPTAISLRTFSLFLLLGALATTALLIDGLFSEAASQLPSVVTGDADFYKICILLVTVANTVYVPLALYASYSFAIPLNKKLTAAIQQDQVLQGG